MECRAEATTLKGSDHPLRTPDVAEDLSDNYGTIGSHVISAGLRVGVQGMYLAGERSERKR